MPGSKPSWRRARQQQLRRRSPPGRGGAGARRQILALAEHEGVLSSFRGALRRPDAAATFQVDSALLVRQCHLERRRRSPSLIPYWERSADLLRRPRDRGTAYSMSDIYQKSNALADGVANEVINNVQGITEDWLMRVTS